MNLHQEVLQINSKASCHKIVDYIGTDERIFAELIQIFLNDNIRSTQASSGIINECIEQNPFLIKPYFRVFIDKLHEPNIHDAAKRNILRAWQFVEIPETYIGEIYDLCYSYLFDNQAIAIKVFAMTVCYNITKNIPELKTELQITIEDLLQKHHNGSMGINSRANKILAKLKKK